jgi:hypothetical protein
MNNVVAESQSTTETVGATATGGRWQSQIQDINVQINFTESEHKPRFTSQVRRFGVQGYLSHFIVIGEAKD